MGGFSHWARCDVYAHTVHVQVNEYCFTSLSAQSGQYRDRRKPEAGTMPYSYFEWLQGFFIVHSTIGSTVHSMPLNSLEHCICTTTMTNIRPDRDFNLVPPGYKPQSIRMSHRGRPTCRGVHTVFIFKPSRCIKASFYIPENSFNFIITKGFRTKIFHETGLQYMAIFFNFSPTSNHLHPLQVENCDSNSRLVVDEDDNGKFRIEMVKGTP